MPTENEQQSEEEKSRKKRITAKGWVTRTSNTLKDLIKTYKENKKVFLIYPVGEYLKKKATIDGKCEKIG